MHCYHENRMIKLSIIIATFNRSAQLRRTLQSLVGQTVSPSDWEVVVVDNNSADNTPQVFAKFAADHRELNLRMVAEPRQGLSWARNRGMAEARGEVLAIIDDDEEVNAEFVAAYLDFFARNPSVAMAGGRVVPVYETERPRWMTRWTERPIAGTLDLGRRERPFTRGYPAGGNLAVRRWVIESYGGFDTSLGRTGTALIGGEEKEFFHRISTHGIVAWYTPQAIIYHIIPPEKLTPDYFRRLALGVGRSQRMMGLGGGFIREVLKWLVTLVLAVFFAITMRPAKAKYLLVLRLGITRGLLGL